MKAARKTACHKSLAEINDKSPGGIFLNTLKMIEPRALKVYTRGQF